MKDTDKTKEQLIIVASILVAAGIFILDLSLPLGVAGGVPYVALVLISLYSPWRHYALMLAVVGTGLTIVGYFFSPPAGISWMVMVNRLLALFAIWVTALFCRQRKQTEVALQAAHNELEQRVEERTIDLQEEIVERKQAEEALRESEETYRTLVERLPIGIVTNNPDGSMPAQNPKALEMFGWGVDNIGSLNVNELYVDPTDRKDLMERLNHDGYHEYEYWLKRKDGTPFLVRGRSVAIFDDGGQPIRYEGYIEDITEQKRLEVQLRQSQKMEAVGQLTAGVAHNFNNRLMVIMNNLELMAHQGGADPETLQAAETSTEQAAEMIKQLLNFTRADKPLQLNPVDLSAVLQKTLTMARQTLDPKMDIDYKLAVHLPTLSGDANQLEQVLMNLLLNARDALEEGAPTSPGIQVRAATVQVKPDALEAYPYAAHGLYIRIQVVDNGIGMDEETQERIYEPFFTTKSVDKGTGLGLATVYGIVQEHKGWIECESQPGVGTTFFIYLPVSREDPHLIG